MRRTRANKLQSRACTLHSLGFSQRGIVAEMAAQKRLENSAEAAGFESESEGRDSADAVEFRQSEVTEFDAQVRESSSAARSETRSADARAAIAAALADAVTAAAGGGDGALLAFAVDALARLASLRR